MKIHNNPVNKVALSLAFAVIVSICLPVAAENQEPGWNLRLRGMLVDGEESFSIDDPSADTVLAGGNGSLGLGIAVEYRISKRFGVELGAAYAKIPDFDWDDNTGGTTKIGEGPTFVPLTASFNIHLTPNSRFDLYVAPTVAYVSYGDFNLDLDGQSTQFDAEGGFAWGGTIGCDYRLGNGTWSLNAAVTYLSSDMDVTERGTDDTVTVSFDPLMVQLGVSFSF